MLISSTLRRQKPRPSKSAMSLPSKDVEVADKAMGDVGEVVEVDLAGKVDLAAALMEAYPKTRLTR
jgi:hypothetical protein